MPAHRLNLCNIHATAQASTYKFFRTKVTYKSIVQFPFQKIENRIKMIKSLA